MTLVLLFQPNLDPSYIPGESVPLEGNTRELTARGKKLLLDYYPIHLQYDPTIQAICNAAAEELRLLESTITVLENNMIPKSAEEHLYLFELMLGLSVNPPNQNIESRRDTVLAFLKRTTLDGSGISWELVANLILGSGWSYSVGGTRNSVLTVDVANVEDSVAANLIQALLRWITPASMTLNINYGDGFILDASTLDNDLL